MIKLRQLGKVLGIITATLFLESNLVYASSKSTAVKGSSKFTSISSGAIWRDTDDNIIEAHGGGILKDGDTYYWYGEDHTNGYYFQNINVYSSKDLRKWKWCGHALTKESSGDLGPNRVVERPKCIYNAATHKYVLFMHIDNSNYSEAKVGVATSDSPLGPFTYINSWRPNGHQSRDMTIFQDGTKAYLVSLGEEGNSINQTDRIFPLSDDYLTAKPEICSFKNAGREGLSVFKSGAYYFIVGSSCTGWSPNQQAYSYSTSLSTGWSSWNKLGDQYCFSSQSNYILPVYGQKTTSYIFMADRWDSSNLANSRYIWLPLNVNGYQLSMDWISNWKIGCSSGSIKINNHLKSSKSSYYIATQNTPNKVVTVGDESILDGSKVIQLKNESNLSQQWKFINTSDGKFNIVNVNSGKYLQAGSDNSVNQCTANNKSNQEWTLQDAGLGYYYIVNLESGKVLDVTSCSTADGTYIEQWTNNGGANQKWRLERN